MSTTVVEQSPRVVVRAVRGVTGFLAFLLVAPLYFVFIVAMSALLEPLIPGAESELAEPPMAALVSAASALGVWICCRRLAGIRPADTPEESVTEVDDGEPDIEDVDPHCWDDCAAVGRRAGGSPATAPVEIDAASEPPRRSRRLVLFASTMPLLLLAPFLTAMEMGDAPGLDAVTGVPVFLSALLTLFVGVGGSSGAAVLTSTSWLLAAGLSFRLTAPWATVLFVVLAVAIVAAFWSGMAQPRTGPPRGPGPS